MAGNFSVETCGNIFQRKGRNASSNYGIGTDGRIGLYCPEKDRSWCSSNRENDHRAITIEVANDGGAETGWHISDAAMDSLIKLCADICKRNGINKLVWSDKKSDRVGHKNGVNMTCHRDFAAKACPGDYIYSKEGYIAAEVNKLLGVVEKPVNEPNTMPQTYIVKKGDTLSKIAKANGTTVKAIQALNPAITNPNRIYVGQTIRIK
jgi:LysM repeat protein